MLGGVLLAAAAAPGALQRPTLQGSASRIGHMQLHQPRVLTPYPSTSPLPHIRMLDSSVPDALVIAQTAAVGVFGAMGTVIAGLIAYVMYVKSQYDHIERLQAGRDVARGRKSRSVAAGDAAFVEARERWTEAELRQYDGSGSEDGPILMAVDGLVFNVARARNLYGPGREYHELAGRDASRLLAKGITSVDRDVSPEADLTLAERGALSAWLFSLNNKYDVVGRLQSAAQAAEAEAAAAARRQRDLQAAAELSAAARAGDLDGVEAALFAGADPTLTDADGEQPLHLAARAGSVGCISALIDAGADVRARGSKGRTALHIAAEVGLLPPAKELLAAGAEANAEANQRWTPLLAASQAGATAVVRLLVAVGADLGKTSEAGVTPLVAAATFGHGETCRALIAAGASVDAAGPRGMTAKEWAQRNGHAAVAWMLEAHTPAKIP